MAVNKWQNCIILICVTVGIVSLYAMGAGLNAFWFAVLLGFVEYRT